MNRFLPACLFVLFSLFAPSIAWADEPRVQDERIEKIVARSLGYIQTQGDAWRNQRDCVSCHRLAFTVWSLNRAAELRFAVDDKAAAETHQWTTDWRSLLKAERREDATEQTALQGENDAVSQLILGRAVDSEEAQLATWRRSLIDSQQSDGSWKAGGQLPTQKRPVRETKEVSTHWAMIALADYGEQNDEFSATMNKAKKWLGDQTQGESTEWWATRLLVERQLGKPESADDLRQQLLALQREDGGWGWLTADESDALATGIALYALAHDGVSGQSPEVGKAIDFLAANQQENGSWPVHGTKKNGKNRVTETATYWGACWAVIGVLEFQRHE